MPKCAGAPKTKSASSAKTKSSTSAKVAKPSERRVPFLFPPTPIIHDDEDDLPPFTSPLFSPPSLFSIVLPRLKEKREPSAYNVFIKENMTKWLKENPGKKAGEAMKELGAQWKDHPKNPNRGKATKPRAKKATAGKENGIPNSDDTILSHDDDE
ncbi:hypothetical protein ONZ45_g12229 [Pleurotus djamor]|nr:hypothetical protein ONZ45_g12229 [Pleurotus djamor]